MPTPALVGFWPLAPDSGDQGGAEATGWDGDRLCRTSWHCVWWDIPLDTPATYDVTQPFARTLAELLERRKPALVVADMAKSKRAGKVLIDWSQNAAHKTTVAVYSLRGSRPRPFVSLPVTWDELARALKKKDGRTLHFDPAAALGRVRALGDLHAPVLRLRQRLPAARQVAQERAA